MKAAQEQAEVNKAAKAEARSPEGLRYLCSVNKGSANMQAWQDRLNQAWANGYRLHTAFEQGGNTVQILEKRD